MAKSKQGLKPNVHSESGATVVETALLLSLISIVGIFSVSFAGNASASSYRTVNDSMSGITMGPMVPIGANNGGSGPLTNGGNGGSTEQGGGSPGGLARPPGGF